MTTNKVDDNAVNNLFLKVLLFSGLTGLLFGLSNATWQVSVETGQVLAGLVKYPLDNPFYIYHMKAFTIVNHISALLLRLNLSERFLSFVISGILGMVSFQALSILILAISRSVFAALFGVILIYLANYVGDGAVYPIWLLGQPHTYGIIGLSFVVLTIALIGAGMYRPALFCLGLAPCVHFSLGMWTIFIIAVASLFQIGFTKEIVRKYYAYFLAGMIIFVGLFSYQLYLIHQLPKFDHGTINQYFDSYIKYWGSHQRKLFWDFASAETRFKRFGILFCIYSIIMSFFCLRLYKDIKPLQLLFRIIMTWGILSLIFGFITQLPPENMPKILLMLMPGRYLNLSNLVITACLFAALTNEQNKQYVVNYNIFVIFLIFSFFSRHAELQLIIFAIILSWLGCLAYKNNFKKINLFHIRKHKVGYTHLLLGFLVIFLLINLPREKYFNKYILKSDRLTDRTNDDFYLKISQREGLLLVNSEFSLIQLRTRRPILADMASPNFFTYAPEAVIGFNDLLLKIYGINLLEAPAIENQHKEIPSQFYKELWEKRTMEQWQEIRNKFGVSDILTNPDWILSLPVVVKSSDGILYEIPQ